MFNDRLQTSEKCSDFRDHYGFNEKLFEAIFHEFNVTSERREGKHESRQIFPVNPFAINDWNV